MRECAPTTSERRRPRRCRGGAIAAIRESDATRYMYFILGLTLCTGVVRWLRPLPKLLCPRRPMAPPELFGGSIGVGKRVAKEEGAGARISEDDNEPDLLKLSPVGEVLHRATEAGSGVLSAGRCVSPTGWSPPGVHVHISRALVAHITEPGWCHLMPHTSASQPSLITRAGRPWVRHEGWLLKESGGPMSSYQPRYFVVAGGKLEYYKEEAPKVRVRARGRGRVGVGVGVGVG